MDFNKLTIKSQEAVAAAGDLARRRGNPEVTPDHLLLALLDQELFADWQGLRADAEEKLARRPAVTGAENLQPRISNALTKVLDAKGIPYKVIPGEAAFYGPKIDIKLVDVLGRMWQLSTVQFDWNLPARFDLTYKGEDGELHQPVMVHRALFGSVERFFGVLIEHYAGAFPMWLAPVQVGLVPISEKHLEYAAHVKAKLEAAGIRVELDARNEKMNAKIREFTLQKVPFVLVMGDKEAASESVSVRTRGKGDEGSVSLEAFLERAVGLVTGQGVGL